ncbi:translation initiation factor IF-2 [Aphanothece hegewaldii CCALA 016]|uniref:Translation initiation factor IF-2 n=1 Tax=Aphanothece hegewaldii CCALA 016 TaxID=2107694 RepID=A0A2T1M2L0_9CHRO|nr:translation initiation factor IF-2 [Aphanothece hegewaldii]PSF38983.1 translation initiation factor IF-2 [Aphanothece hegewaldii CCALA 016]
MNNSSKVRIYELSKELNLENKDILDICEQLNISVKSHSSTITESEADRIKSVAAKQAQNPTHHHKAQGNPSNEGSHSSSGEKKQQILAVHYKNNRPNSPNNGQDVAPALVAPSRRPSHSNSNSTLANPPLDHSSAPSSESQTYESQTSEEPSETPTGVDPINLNQTDLNQTKREKLAPNNNKPVIQAEKKPIQPSAPQRTAKMPSQEPEILDLEAGNLQSPTNSPDSPSTPKVGERTPVNQKLIQPQDRSGTPRPEIKLDRNPKPQTDRPGRASEVSNKVGNSLTRKNPTTGTVEALIKPKDRDRDRLREKDKDKEREKKVAEIPKATVELKRPTRPIAPQKLQTSVIDDLATDEPEEIDSPIDEADDLLTDVAGKPKQKPKKSIPIRQSKRQEWEDGEDDKEDKSKSGKLAKTGKNKRRSQVLFDEEDDDLDAELLANQASASISLSMARPPKPNSSNSRMPIAAAVNTTANKPKKPSSKSESSNSRSKNDRQDNKEENKRPESITLNGSLTIRGLSELMKVPETEIIKNLFFKGVPVNITQTLDQETIEMIAADFEIKVETGQIKAAATKTTEMIDVADLDNLQTRPPVVTIMGHVDHGKTTLLDSIRKTKVAQGEAGGITQHIGAYHVDVEHNGKPQQIVFLDTPGHEAFTAMRARGARVTDIAILVVAADDGVQPQTREAVSHAKAAGVPIIVAINKVDKLDSNPDRIKQELSELGLVPEAWGGDTIMVPVSALKGENLDTLLEMILLVSEVEELSANPNRPAKGTVIEAHLDRNKGPVATLIVQNGTLRVGDTVVAGSVFGKIRAMIDDRGDKVDAATPSFAVEVLGLGDVPAAGDEFDVFINEKEARITAEGRSDAQRQTRLQQALSTRRVTLSTISAQAQEGKLKELNLILKTDVQGSVEAILTAMNQLPQKEVQIRVLLAAPGEVTETDVDLAAASGAVIVGFNTTLATGSRAAADREGVDIREYNIIYKLLDEIQGAMEGLLEPEQVEEHLGFAEVRAVFPVGRGTVAGCYVLSGKLVRNRFIRVRRKGEVVHEGNLDSLKRMKEDTREVNAGYECGVGLPKFNTWLEGDQIEAYEMVMKRRTLSV